MIAVHNDYFVAMVTRVGAVSVDWLVRSVDGFDDADAPVAGEVFAAGHVKWDGCSNWSFNDGHHLHHACDRAGLAAIGDILAKCHDASHPLFPGSEP